MLDGRDVSMFSFNPPLFYPSVDLETTAKGEHLLTALFGVCIENCVDVVPISRLFHKLSLTFCSHVNYLGAHYSLKVPATLIHMENSVFVSCLYVRVT